MSSHNLQETISVSSKKKSQMKILKKRGPDIDPCGTPDSTLLHSLNEELTLTFWIWLDK